MSATTTLRHGKVDLALHRLREGDGRPLLLLHALGERSPAVTPAWATAWPGPVLALDFPGHGSSGIPAGGGYTCEVLMADVDTVLADQGELTVAGRGLGGYVALLIAGARPTSVRGAVIADGPGLAGGGSGPTSQTVALVSAEVRSTPDPFALIELSRDVRPPDYATSFARQAAHLSGLDTPVTVCAVVRPEWLEAIAGEPGVADAPSLEVALASYATL